MNYHLKDFFGFKIRVAGILSAAATVCCVATAMSWLGNRWWLFELTTHFVVQYFVILAFAAGIFAYMKRLSPALVCMFFAVANLLSILPMYMRDQTPSTVSTFARVVFMNVHSENKDYGKASAFADSCNGDFFVAEEINEDWFGNLKRILEKYPYSVGRPRPDEFGLALFSKNPLKESAIIELSALGFPSIRASTVIGTTRVTILALHPPPPIMELYREERIRQIEKLASLAMKEENAVVLGDLNMTPWSPIFKDLLLRACLFDGRKGFGICPTWPANLPWMLIPLDHCLTSKEITVTGFSTGPNIGSDHYPIVVDLGRGARKVPLPVGAQ